MKVLATGLTGLVGSRVKNLLDNKYQFENLGRDSGVDITDKDQVFEKIRSSDFEVFLHLAGKTHVDGCEEDKAVDNKFLDGKITEEEIRDRKTAWAINVLGTRNIAEAVAERNKKLIYVSTDFVFDGKDTDGYSEDDSPNPINWYGKTKYEGEKKAEVLESHLILRISYPYRSDFTRNDFVRTVLSKLEKKEEVSMVEDHIMTPTFIDDIARGLDILISEDVKGTYHLVGNQFVSPYEAAQIIAERFSLDKSNISKTTREEFFKNRAPRPFFLGLKNDRITRLQINMRTFEEGIDEIKKQLEETR